MIRFDVRHYDRIGSTNDEALRLAREGAPHGTVVCAREQAAGRGRQGRQWHSPTGNMYVSILLRPDAPAGSMPELGFVAALAVADVVDRFLPAGTRCHIKWPNDVLVNGAKIAGILIESEAPAVVVGMGINIALAPGGMAYPVTRLGPVVTPEACLPILLDVFDSRLSAWETQGFAPTRSAWLERAHQPGSPLRVSIGANAIAGSFVGIGDAGELLLDTSHGIRHIFAGEVEGNRLGSCERRRG